MRCALYARYSSDLQRAESIEDQLRSCRTRAEREGWRVVHTFSDAALSGASLQRPGYNDLLAAIRAGGVDVVLTESLDRLSRDLEHIAAFHRRGARPIGRTSASVRRATSSMRSGAVVGRSTC